MKPRVVNLSDCEPFITKDGSRIRELMAPRNSLISRQSLAEAVVPAGGATTEHFHSTSEEIYYILEGVGEMRVGGEIFRVGPGDAVALPPGTIHKIWNRGDCDLIFLCICVPPYEHDDTVMTEK